jgi:uncharacterized protein DUF4386
LQTIRPLQRKDKEKEEMNSLKKTARLAGLFWVLSAVTTFFNLQIVRLKLIVPGDAAAIANNILADEFLFRIGIASNLLSQVFLLFFGLVMYRVFNRVNKTWSTVFLTAILMTVSITFANTVNYVAPLVVLSKADYLNVFQQEQRHAIMMIFFRLNDYGQLLLEIFWGLFLFALGLLIVKSRFAPRILGIFLIIHSFVFPFNTLTKLVIPHFYPKLITQLTLLFGPLSAPAMFWLLVKGAKEEPQQPPQ